MIFRFGCFLLFVFSIAHGALLEEGDQRVLPFGTVTLPRHLREDTFEPGSPPQAGQSGFVVPAPSAQWLKERAARQAAKNKGNNQETKDKEKQKPPKPKKKKVTHSVQAPVPDNGFGGVLDGWLQDMEF